MPNDVLTTIRVTIDAAGQLCGLSILVDGPDWQSVRPMGVGPFETPHEAFERALATVDVQQRLW